MKRLLLIVVVAALALTLVPLAFAGAQGGGGHKKGHGKFNLVGKVTGIAVAPAVDPLADPPAEPTASTITIAVKAGSHIKGIKRTVKTFDVAAGAKVWLLTGDGAVAGELSDVEADDWVKVKGTITKVGDGKAYLITSIKYRDLTPTPVVEPTPEASTTPVAQ